MSEASYELRAMAGAALLSRHLFDCIKSHARGTPWPEIDVEPFDSPDDVEHAFAAVAAMLGQSPDDEKAVHRVMVVMQAIAEMLAAHGAQLECELAGVILGECREIRMVREVPACEGAA